MSNLEACVCARMCVRSCVYACCVFAYVFQGNVSQCASPHNPTAITADEYFDSEFNLNGRDIGRPVELTSKVQRYRPPFPSRHVLLDLPLIILHITYYIIDYILEIFSFTSKK